MWVFRLRPIIFRSLLNISCCGPVNILQDGYTFLSVRNPLVNYVFPAQYSEGNELCQEVVNPESQLPTHIRQTILNLRDIDKSAGEPENILKSLESAKDQLTLEELVYGLFYLSRHLQDSPLLLQLVQYSLERTTNGEKLDLPSISRLSVTLNAMIHVIPSFFTYPVIIPRIAEHLHRKDLTEEELMYLTVAMKQTMRLLTTELMDLYRDQVESFYQSGSFNTPGTATNNRLLKICNFLNSSPWSMENSNLLRKLMQRIDANHLETPQDLSVAFKITQGQLEPRPLLSSILNRSIELRKALQETPISHPLLLLQCDVVKTLPESRRNLVAKVEEYLLKKEEILSTEDVLLTFKILRKAKVSKPQLCNIYWNKVLEKIKSDPEEQETDRLIHHCHRYMYFNNNLGGTYRFFPIERFLMDLILTDLREGLSQFVPSKMSRLLSFLIGYGTSDTIPLLDKLINSHEQLGLGDCLQLSRGIQIALELRFRKGMPHEFSRQILSLETAIDHAVTKRLAITKHLSITDANIILRGLSMRKSNKKSKVFKEVVRRFETVDFAMTSRIIRDTTMNLNLSRIKAPELLETFLNYIVQQSDSITGDTVEKILHTCFSLGHDTANHEALQLAAGIIQRDFDYMTGLAIVNSCLSLCYYGELSQQLMAKVFCIDFIKRLEEEIKMCYSKATYPQRVLNKVMQLNRSVCLDHPEYSVPWFQQNYVEAQTTKSSPNELFQKDILHRFKQIFGDQVQHIELNHSTAYGYRLDFLLKLKDNGKLSTATNDDEKISRKLAVVLLNQTSFCQNDPTTPCGYEQLRRRHLEILGFEVMEISYGDWTKSKLTVDHLRQQFIARNII